MLLVGNSPMTNNLDLTGNSFKENVFLGDFVRALLAFAFFSLGRLGTIEISAPKVQVKPGWHGQLCTQAGSNFLRKLCETEIKLSKSLIQN